MNTEVKHTQRNYTLTSKLAVVDQIRKASRSIKKLNVSGRQPSTFEDHNRALHSARQLRTWRAL